MDAQSENHPANGKLYLQINSMYDAHISRGGHLTDEMIEEVKAGNPEFVWNCKIHGIPSAGDAAVFPFQDSEITFNPSDINIDTSEWLLCAGLDFGLKNDPSTIVFAAKNQETGITYLFNEWRLSDGIEGRSPDYMAKIIKESEFPNIFVMGPHDTNNISVGAFETRAEILRMNGINIGPKTFENPIELRNKYTNKSTNAIQPGLDEMYRMFKQGRLKVSQHMVEWLKEKQRYFYVTRNNKLDYAGPDHVIDASRIAVMTLARNFGNSPLQARDYNADQWDSYLPEPEDYYGNPNFK